MKIKNFMFALVFTTFMLSGVAFAGEGVSKATIDEYRQIKIAADKLVGTNAGKYAKDIIEKVNNSVLKAQQAIEAGDEKITKQVLEITNLQVTLAKVTADQREAAESAANARAELKKYEQRMEDILAGKGEVK